jgi:uncharacterized coiled-coil DUF342 family protein
VSDARVAELEARVAELAEERARLWEEVNRLRAERREVEYFETLARHMEGSLSWQITAPLRTAKALKMRVQRKLEERRA